ncbi:hypothetical protein BN871_DT_00130 [Paenibacillus sp. P22]|nr:hypothetical protein BN871_DT_00130 [Paenibacillus sp. P22]
MRQLSKVRVGLSKVVFAHVRRQEGREWRGALDETRRVEFELKHGGQPDAAASFAIADLFRMEMGFVHDSLPAVVFFCLIYWNAPAPCGSVFLLFCILDFQKETISDESRA